MKANVYKLDGTKEKEIQLPEIFSEAIRPDIINRAFLSASSNRYQPKSAYKRAGLNTSATYVGRRAAYRTGMNIGSSRVKRIKLAHGKHGEARITPHTRKGREAHPPVKEKIIAEKINRKERRKAIKSAIAATASKETVEKRGHKVKDIQVPIVINDSLQAIKKTKELRQILEKLNLADELKRAEKKSIRAGRGTTRGRKYRKKKSILIIITKLEGIQNAAKNMPGIDITTVKNINIIQLAPGGAPGRLTIYTESAINELKKMI